MTIGLWQILLVGLVVAALFGSRHIPALAAEAGRGLASLRRQFAGKASADEPFDEAAADRTR